MGSADGFPAKQQKFKVERSALETERDWRHCSTVGATEPANGHSPACVAANGADEDHFGYSLCFHPCNGEERQQGVGARRMKPPSLAVGDGPYFRARTRSPGWDLGNEAWIAVSMD